MFLTNYGKAYLPIREISLFCNTSEKHQKKLSTVTLITCKVPGSQFFKLRSNAVLYAPRKSNKSSHSSHDAEWH